MTRINLFTPVRQDPATLALVLKSHRALVGISERHYTDDNTDPESSRMLAEEAALDGVIVSKPPDGLPEGTTGHKWHKNAVDRMSEIRNAGMRTNLPDYVFTADSDIVLPPGIVPQLACTGEEIVSEVFWSRWPGAATWMPQVWDRHPYAFDGPDSILRLKHPGLFRVGGLGACTKLMNPSAFVSYTPIESLRSVLWGEDRWFCVRAECAGYKLYADTRCPPFHVYTPDQLEEARAWYDDGAHPGYFRKYWLNDEWEETIRAMFRK